MKQNRPSYNAGDNIYYRRVKRIISPRESVDSSEPDLDYSDTNTDYSSADTDYSTPNTDNDAVEQNDTADDLRNAEQSYGNQGQAANDVEQLSKNEHNSTDSSFKYKSRTNNNAGFFMRHKKALLGGTVGTFVVGGMMSTSMLMSGPVQLIHITNFLRDSYNTVHEIQSAMREAKNLRSIAGGMVKKIKMARAEAQVYGRVGVIGRLNSQRYIDNLKKIGIEAKIDPDTKSYKLEINPKMSEIDFGCKGQGCVAKQVSNKLGGKAEYYEVDIKNEKISVNVDKIKGANRAHKFLNGLGKRSGMSFLSRWTGVRSFAKESNIISIFHPFRKLDKFVNDKFSELLHKIGKKSKEKFNEKFGEKFENLSARIKDYLASRSAASSSSGNGTSLLGEADEKTKKAVEENKQSVDREVKTTKSGYGRIKAVAAKTLGAAAIAGILCGIVKFADKLEKIRWITQAMPAIKVSGETMAASGQMLDGNLSMSQVALFSQHQLYDEYAESKPDGKPAPSSWWDSAPVNAELGLEVNDAKKLAVPPNLINMQVNPAQPIISAFNSMGGAVKGGVDAVCNFIGNPIVGIISLVAAISTAPISGLLFAGAQMALMPIISGYLTDLLTGGELDITHQTPARFGDIAAYGSKFNQSQNGLIDGGTVLTDKQAAQINRQKNIWLAQEWNDKPVIARLFDPTDYKSAISTVARNAKLDPNPNNILASLTNVMRLATAIPTTAVALAANEPYAAASAASGRKQYDYGVPEIALPPQVIDKFTRSESDSYDLLENAKRVMDVFHKDTTELKKLGLPDTPKSRLDPRFKQWADTKKAYSLLTSVCLFKNISDDGDVSYDKTVNEENGGSTFMYLTGNSYNKDYIEKDCKGKLNSDETLQRIAVYAGLDNTTVLTNKCLTGDEKSSDTSDACRQVGLGGAASSQSNNGTVDGSGNKSADYWEAKLREEAPNLSYGSYSWSGNGCTTVPAWFIGEHTDLTYGNGNGGQVADQLVAANPGAGISVSDTPQAPAIFSTYSNGASQRWGHTGLVTSVDPDGTMHTLEMALGRDQTYKRTYSKSMYAGKYKFVYVGGHLK